MDLTNILTATFLVGLPFALGLASHVFVVEPSKCHRYHSTPSKRVRCPRCGGHSSASHLIACNSLGY